MSKRRVKFVVIGCGHIGKRHAQMIVKNPEAELVGLVDIDQNALEASHHFAVRQFSSVTELLLSDLDFDVANIAVPNGLHAELAKMLLLAGKHCVIEKPMALSSEEALEVKELADRLGLHIFVVMQNRYSPPAQWLKQMVDSGTLGTIFMVQMNCFWNRDSRYYVKDSWHGSAHLDGGTLFTQFSHFIDLFYWIFGDIKEIKGFNSDFAHQQLTEFEDSGVLCFRLESGGLGNLNFSTAVWDKNLESNLTIVAEKGSIKVGGQYMDKVEYCHVKDYKMPILEPTSPSNDYGLYKGSAANHHFVIENVIDVIQNGGEIMTTAEEGIKVVNMIERMYEVVID